MTKRRSLLIRSPIRWFIRMEVRSPAPDHGSTEGGRRSSVSSRGTYSASVPAHPPTRVSPSRPKTPMRCDGLAIRREVTIRFGRDAPALNLLLYLPKAAAGVAPSFSVRISSATTRFIPIRASGCRTSLSSRAWMSRSPRAARPTRRAASMPSAGRSSASSSGATRSPRSSTATFFPTAPMAAR